MTRHTDVTTVRGEITRQFLAHRHLIVPPILEGSGALGDAARNIRALAGEVKS